MAKSDFPLSRSENTVLSLTISAKEADRFLDSIREILGIGYARHDTPEGQHLLSLETMFNSGQTEQLWFLLLELLSSVKISQEQHQQKTQELFNTLVKEVLAIEEEIVVAFTSTAEAISRRANQYDKELVNYVGGLATEITQAASLDTLKTAAMAHLSNMRKSIKERHKQEKALMEANKEEIAKLSAELEITRTNLANTQQESKLIEEAALTCPLTKVSNKRAMDKLLQAACTEDFYWPFCLAVLDVDAFKHFNDNFGHQAGDKVLITMTQQVLANLRAEDLFFRYAGDEFVIVFRNMDLDEAYQWTERIRSAVESVQFRYKKETLRITISAGITQVKKGDTVATLFERADQALLESKRKNRNCVSVYAPA